MKKIMLVFAFISSIFTGFSQVNTEVYLFDLEEKKGEYTLSKGKNISNNEGYDSQPSFYDDNTILFASDRKGQTDIAIYTINNGEKSYISNTPNGGEYSPERMPNSKDISAVRLDKSGLQRFYQYDLQTGKSTELIKNLVVAYPRWVSENILAAVTIVDDTLNLEICDLKSGKNMTVAKNVGRSVHKIPNSNLLSFISKKNKEKEVKSLNLKTLEVKSIIRINDKEDVCWLPNGILLISYDKNILKFNPKTDKNWSVFYSFSDKNIDNISRIMVNEQGTKLVLVAETL